MSIEVAKEVISKEIEVLENLLDKIDDNFVKAVKLIEDSQGRVIVSGVGKSGHIGRKIAASLASTGTPSFFVHADEAAHGDLGMITQEDVVILISYSGGTAETVNVVPHLRKIGAKLIAITGKPESELAENCDVVLDIGVKVEADPLGLAPTSSTTATLVLGDALTVALLVSRGFTKADFAKYHPGGALGRKLAEDLSSGEKD